MLPYLSRQRLLAELLMKPNRMLRDVEFFRSRTSKLDGAAGLGEYLVKIVDQKAVAESTPNLAEKPDGDTTAAQVSTTP